MSTALPTVEPGLATTQATDSFQLLPESQKAGAAEDEVFNQQIQAVKKWWSSPRYKGIKRPYTPEDVVSKRGTLQQAYPSNVMARKLFNLLEERASQGQPVHTMGSDRSCSNDTTSASPRNSLRLRLGMFVRPDIDQ